MVSGNASIAQSGVTTTINQTSQNSALNWQSFNIGSGETVNFVQPSATAISVNRILGNSGSQILGSLNANGQVFLINPNGVLFGQGAQVNVGGLVASTLNYDPGSSSPGSYFFTGNGTGSVSNAGQITTSHGGYVALLANQVSNTGNITAPGGMVAMAAGTAVNLGFNGSTLVQVQVSQSTANNLASNGGLIQANGGRVLLTAGAANSVLPSVVNNTGIIEARTVQDLGGDIVLLGGGSASTVNVGGTLDASAPNGGHGGAIETSAAAVHVVSNAVVSTLAANGQSGNWLIDPPDFTVAASGGDQTGTQLSNALALGNVTISSATGTSAVTGGGAGGNININAPVTWSASNSLTLNASNNININAAVTANTSTPPTTLMSFNTGTGTLNFGPGGSVSMPYVGITAPYAGFQVNGTPHTVLNTVSALSSVALGGNYVLGSDLQSTGNFTPIGTFTGDLNGLGHTISGLTISGSGNVGLISVLSGQVENIGLTGANVGGNGGTTNTGALAGVNQGSITNAYVNSSSTVAGASGSTYGTGGLVGSNGTSGGASGSITESYSQAAVNAPSAMLVGGLVGVQWSGTIANSFATGNVNGYLGVGGLAGGVAGGSIINSYATGSVIGPSNSDLGGLVGSVTGAPVFTAVYSTGAVSIPGQTNGGLVGAIVNPSTFSNALCTACFYTETASTSAIGTIETGAQMMSSNALNSLVSATPGGSGVWVGYSGQTNPLLQSFMTPVSVSATAVYNATNEAGLANAAVTYSSYGATLGTPLANVGGVLSASNPGGGTVVNVANNYTLSGQYPSNQLGYLLSYNNLSITPAPLTITVPNQSITYGSSILNSQLAATAVGLVGGQQLVNYGLSSPGTTGTANAGVYSISTNANNITGALGFLPSNYSISYGSVGSYTVNPFLLSVSGQNVTTNKTYDGTTTAAVTNAGTVVPITLPNGNSLPTVSTASANYASPNANTPSTPTTNITVQTTLSNPNYAVANTTLSGTISPATLMVTGESAVAKTYNGSTTATLSGGTLSGVAAVDSGNVTLVQAGSFSSPNVAVVNGTPVAVPVTAADSVTFSGGALSTNYTALVQPTGLSAVISPAALTVTGQSVTSKVYDGTTVATLSGGTLSGVVAADVSNVTLTTQAGTFSSANAGTAVPVTTANAVTFSGSALSTNYTVTQVSGLTGKITPADLTVTGQTVSSKVYDGSATATLTGGTLSGVPCAATAPTLVQAGSYASANAGTGIVVTAADSLSGATAANYTLTQPTGLTGTITPATLLITATPTSKVYGQTNPVLSGTVTGLVGSDTLAGTTSGALGFTTSATATSGVGSYAVTGGGLTMNSGNYTLAQAPGNSNALNVTPATLTVAGQTVQNKVYDTTTSATLAGGSLIGLVNGDAVTLVSAGNFVQTNAGTGLAVAVSDSISGSAAANYTLVQPKGLTGSITPAPLTVTGQAAANKPYDGNTTATLSGGSLSGVLSADIGNVSLTTVSTGNFVSPIVGNNIVVVPTTPDGLTGTAAANYALTQPVIKADILSNAVVTTLPQAQAQLETTLGLPIYPLAPGTAAPLNPLVVVSSDDDAKKALDPTPALILQPNEVMQALNLHVRMQGTGVKLPDDYVKLSDTPVKSN